MKCPACGAGVALYASGRAGDGRTCSWDACCGCGARYAIVVGERLDQSAPAPERAESDAAWWCESCDWVVAYVGRESVSNRRACVEVPEGDAPDRLRCAGCYSPPVRVRIVMETDARRAPVQGDKIHPAGTVPWAVHQRAWENFAACGHGAQSAERIAERHGFSYQEIQCALAGHYNQYDCPGGHPPIPGWEPRERATS